MKLTDRRPWLAGAVSLAAVAGGCVALVSTAQAAAGCQVGYTVTSQWPGGFGAGVSVTDLGSAVSSWTLTWTFGAGQTITQLWNGSVTQSGAQVTVTNASYNGAIPAGGSVSFGFNGAWSGSNPVPTSFALNGVTCNGGTGTATPTPTATPTSASPSPTPSSSGTGGTGSLPGSFAWSSSNILISPQSNATHNLIAVKDPSVVQFNGRWYVYMSTVDSNGNYGMATINFTDWSQAASAPVTYLDTTAIGGGYKTAPMLFYFAPQKLWYLSYQTGANIAYSTNPDITNPTGWSAPKNYYSSEPAIISQNIGGGFWVDAWTICDSANCYLFSADDNGHLYRSTTSLASFPSGFDASTVIAASDPNKNNFFEADNVYQVAGANEYLLIMEAFGPDGHRQFHSYTAPSLTGAWSPLAATGTNPFAGDENVTFSGSPWTQDVSSGEAIRTNYDQTVQLSPCKLQYLYQGVAPGSTESYNMLPWRIGLLTQTNSTC
jgi:endo-1,4-beta-xylanase